MSLNSYIKHPPLAKFGYIQLECPTSWILPFFNSQPSTRFWITVCVLCTIRDKVRENYIFQKNIKQHSIQIHAPHPFFWHIHSSICGLTSSWWEWLDCCFHHFGYMNERKNPSNWTWKITQHFWQGASHSLHDCNGLRLVLVFLDVVILNMISLKVYSFCLVYIVLLLLWHTICCRLPLNILSN